VCSLLTSDSVVKPRFSEVDSLRAVACALVVFGHAGRGLAFPIVAELARGSGLFGVLLFFAISGYVVPSSLRGERWGGVKNFAIRRFWRLYPPLWFALAVACVAETPAIKDGRLLWGFTMLPSLLGGKGLVQSHFWTLEVELVFYLILAALFFIFGRLGRGVVFIFYLISIGFYIGLLGDVRGANYWERFPLYIATMFYGASCRIIMQHYSPVSSKWKRSTLLGVATGLLVIWPAKTAYFGLMESSVYQLESSVLLLLVISSFLIWVIIRPVKIEWLSHIGRWTYSVYLLHLSVRRFLGASLEWLPHWAYITVVIVISFALGAAAYRWIEQPSDRIGKRLAG